MENRLNLLYETGVIDRDICDGMLQVVGRMDKVWHLPVYTDQGAMAVTHMANALMRSRRGEVIAPLNRELQAELAESPHWQAVCEANQTLLSEFTVTLHQHENGYLLANLYCLWMAARNNSLHG
jgi:hypothetical protein